MQRLTNPRHSNAGGDASIAPSTTKHSPDASTGVDLQNPDRLLNRAQVEALFGIPKRFLEIAAMRCEGPPLVRVGKRCVRYRVQDLKDWIAVQRITPPR